MDNANSTVALNQNWEFGMERFVETSATAVKESKVEPIIRGQVSYTEACGILAPFITDDRLAKIREVIDQRCGGTRFLIENPTNPSNAWACLRTLDSFGVQYVDVVMDPMFYQVLVLHLIVYALASL